MTPLPLALLAGVALAGSASPQSGRIDIAQEIERRVAVVRQWAREPVVVSTVLQSNARALSMTTIQERDRVWQATAGIDPFMQELLDAPCSARLRELSLRTPELGEAFVTDRRGANVAMTRRTSDYFQGDEDKFQKAFTGRLDAYHIDPVQFDESIQAYAVQIAVPVASGGVAVGVLVVTVNLEQMVGL